MTRDPSGGRRRGPASTSRRPPRRPGPVVRRGTARLPHEVARRVRAGHPWIYREALARKIVGDPGQPIELVDWDGDFVGRGICDGTSAIAVRMVTRAPEREVGPTLFAERVREAVALRRRFFDFDEYQCLRLINGESDGIPGVVVERYGDFLVMQLSTAAMEFYRPAILDALESALSPEAIYEQRRFRPLSGEPPPRVAAELVRGRPAPVELEVREGPLRFYVDVTAPLSTGLFADLREGRRAVASWAKGRRVLNLFSYTGAISVYALHGGASEVVSVDVAAKAHARARRNVALSGFDPEAPEFIVGDAFKTLAKFAERGRQFDMVCLDPPAFASASKGGRPWSSVKDYRELIAAALKVTAPGGALAAASSTHKMSFFDFDYALAEGADRADTELRIVDRRWLPLDFPVLAGFPEGNYLKFSIAIRG